MSVVDIRVAAYRVPVVFPATATSPPIVKNLQIIGNIAPPSLEVAGNNLDGSPIWGVRSAERQQGVRLLQELYAEENNPEGWAHYQRYLKLWRDGQTFSSFPQHLLPKKLQDKRAAMEAVDPFSAANQPDPAKARPTGETVAESVAAATAFSAATEPTRPAKDGKR